MQRHTGTYDCTIWYVPLLNLLYILSTADLSLSIGYTFTLLKGCQKPLESIPAADYGVEEAVSIDDLDTSAITQKLKELVTKGESMPK